MKTASIEVNDTVAEIEFGVVNKAPERDRGHFPADAVARVIGLHGAQDISLSPFRGFKVEPGWEFPFLTRHRVRRDLVSGDEVFFIRSAIGALHGLWGFTHHFNVATLQIEERPVYKLVCNVRHEGGTKVPDREVIGRKAQLDRQMGDLRYLPKYSKPFYFEYKWFVQQGNLWRPCSPPFKPIAEESRPRPEEVRKEQASTPAPKVDPVPAPPLTGPTSVGITESVTISSTSEPKPESAPRKTVPPRKKVVRSRNVRRQKGEITNAPRVERKDMLDLAAAMDTKLGETENPKPPPSPKSKLRTVVRLGELDAALGAQVPAEPQAPPKSAPPPPPPTPAAPPQIETAPQNPPPPATESPEPPQASTVDPSPTAETTQSDPVATATEIKPERSRNQRLPMATSELELMVQKIEAREDRRLTRKEKRAMKFGHSQKNGD